MTQSMTRRQMLGTAAATGVASMAFGQIPGAGKQARSIRIIGLACSPRKGKTTATAVQAALDAASKVDPRIATRLIDLGGMSFTGWTGGAKPNVPAATADDFDKLVLPHLKDPVPAALIIGSPVYFRCMSSLCMAMIERLAALRQNRLLLADVPVGVLSVGGFRNGGQELTIQQIQTALLCHEAMIVGGKPSAHQGATLLNPGDDDITKDELGMKTAALLGERVAEAALKLDRIHQ